MSKCTYTIEQLQTAVNNNLSIAGVLRELGLRPIGGNYRTVKNLFREYSIDTKHFTGMGWNVGLKFRPQKTFKDSEIFIENSNYKATSKLKEKLIIGNYRKEECENCHNSTWLNGKIPLEIHHINGVNTDHRIENL